ncbi:uncharacterized protein K02A2.6-like [Ornithodoros turicata]|uniref:uncharacterized protein K02A2.6-like n=1 Tax=Ornithodoros turicata TaxID=34597 RepID=UPI00313961AA
MSFFGLQPPAPFLPLPGDPELPWEQWRSMFLNYLAAITDTTFTGPRKKAVLLHCLGAEGQRIFQALETATVVMKEGEGDGKDGGKDESKQSEVLEEALQILDKRFGSAPNVAVLRHRFRARRQQPGESTQAFVGELRCHAAKCQYGTFEDDAVRDQLLEGTVVPGLRERLLIEGGRLSLSAAVTLATTYEESIKAAKEFQQSGEVQKVDKYRQQERRKGKWPQKEAKGADRQPTGGPKPTLQRAGKQLACYRCGKIGHFANDGNCRAIDKKCRGCGKIGHLIKVCRNSKTINAIQSNDEDIAVLRIGDGHANEVYAEVIVEDVSMRLTVDTGSAASLMRQDVYKVNFERKYPLAPPPRKLVNYSNQKISVTGCFEAKVVFKDKVGTILFYVVPRGTTLLGRDAVRVLNICIEGKSLQCLSIDGTDESVLPPDLRREFGQLFEKRIGFAKGFMHKVHVKADVKPVAQKLRRLPLALRDRVSKELNKLESEGIIERVDASPWVSPIVVVQKPDGNIRLCVDLREPNKAIVADAYPLPTVEELLNSLSGANYFAKLDLASAYYQVDLSQESRALTTFITHEGLFRFRRVCFGLASAPSVFQKLMLQLLRDCQGVVVYLDDVVVFGSDREEYRRNLRRVLKKIAEAGLTLNRKCVFDRQEIQFLGHQLSSGGIRPLQSKIDAVMQAPAQKNQEGLRAFIGLTGYYARFVPRYAHVVEPLRRLLRKGASFEWNKEADEAFRRVKQLLGAAGVLRPFDPKLPVIVTTDASSCGVGAVLQQRDEKSLHTVAFASRTLSTAERNYSTGEREALACIWACERWHVYLWGRHFTLRTDHRALVTLLSTRGQGHRPLRIVRWTARLLNYHYTVEHKKGYENVIADALSRLPLSNSEETKFDEEVVSWVTTCLTKAEVQRATEQDDLLKKVITYIRTSWPVKRSVSTEEEPFYQVREELSVVDGLVYRGERLVVPKQLSRRIISQAHQAHQGMVRTKQRIRQVYWWTSMDREVEEYVKSCAVCQAADKSARVSPAPLQPVPLPEGPWQKLAIDIVGPFQCAPQGCRFAISLMDYFSRWPEVAFVGTVTAQVVIGFLQRVFCREGLPNELVSDHGPQFTSAVFEEFLKNQGIKHLFSSVYYPQANGLIERFNRVLKDQVQLAVLQGKPVTEVVQQGLLAFRCTPHATTGCAPAVLLHGRMPRTKLHVVGIAVPSTPPGVDLRRKVSDRQEYMKRYTDARRGAKSPQVNPGDFVRIKLKEKGKAMPRFSRPLKVLKKCGKNSFLLQDRRVWNASKLALYSRPVSTDAACSSELLSPAIYSGVQDVLCGDVQAAQEPEGPTNIDTGSDVQTPEPVPPATSTEEGDEDANVQGTVPEGQHTSRPRRVRRPPAYLRDYVLD